MLFDNESELPDGLVSIPPVIVSPFTYKDLSADPYHIAKRNLRDIHKVSLAGEGIRVAVIDTGVDHNHVDIRHAIDTVADATSSRGSGVDNHGHGTHVISTIVGMRCGGAPRAKMLSVKALDDSGIGQDIWIVKAIEIAIEWKANAINMSLGSPHPSNRILAALTRAYNLGILVFAATGNESASNNSFPANFNDVCVAVAAVDKNHRRAAFSNAGQGTDICDYGVDVVAARAGGGVVSMSGTSMATPNATAMAANRLSYEKAYNLPQISLKQRYAELPSFCIDLGSPGRDRSTGFGIIDAFKAFGQRPVNAPVPVQPPAPEPTKPTEPPSPGIQPDPTTPPNNPTETQRIGTIWKKADGSLLVMNERGNILPLG
jgi:subtilisin family serine protease